MPELLLVNPLPRPSRRGFALSATDRRTALAAMASSSRPGKPKRKTNPKGKATMAKAKKRKHKARKTHARKVVKVTHARKHKRKSSKRKLHRIGAIRVATGRRTKSGRRKTKSRSIYAMNPISPKGLMGMAIPAVIGAAGAIGLNEALKRMTFLPDTFTTGYMNYATRAIVAVGAGMLLTKFNVLDAGKRNALVGGALVVTAYDALMDLATSQGWIGGGMSGYEYINQNMQGYQPLEGLGFITSAPIAGTMSTANRVTA